VIRPVVINSPAEVLGMSRFQQFSLPFSAPSPSEARALEIAASYLQRAANEAKSRRLAYDRSFANSTALDDLTASLAAAGDLCHSVIETTHRGKTFL